MSSRIYWNSILFYTTGKKYRARAKDKQSQNEYVRIRQPPPPTYKIVMTCMRSTRPSHRTLMAPQCTSTCTTYDPAALCKSQAIYQWQANFMRCPYTKTIARSSFNWNSNYLIDIFHHDVFEWHLPMHSNIEFGWDDGMSQETLNRVLIVVVLTSVKFSSRAPAIIEPGFSLYALWSTLTRHTILDCDANR